MSLEHELNDLLPRAESAVSEAETLFELEKVRVAWLGKQGELTKLLKSLRTESAEKRPVLGQLVNTAKRRLQHQLEERTRILKQHQLSQQLSAEQLDETLSGRYDPVGSMHPITHISNRVVDFFTSYGFSLVEGPEIEDAYYNFEALNMPPAHPARAATDTFYFSDGRLLRTHTSPVQIRAMEEQKGAMQMIALGPVYRPDLDQTHTPMFNQVEGMVVKAKEDKESATFSGLKGLLQAFLDYFFATTVSLRFRPSYFPFTAPSAEVDLWLPSLDAWLEILGCGMIHPAVLRRVGLDPDQYQGFAFGIGLDRLAMLLYDIPDLRLLFENDLRFLRQF